MNAKIVKINSTQKFVGLWYSANYIQDKLSIAYFVKNFYSKTTEQNAQILDTDGPCMDVVQVSSGGCATCILGRNISQNSVNIERLTNITSLKHLLRNPES